METALTSKHPGELLLSELSKLGMKQKELALRTGLSEKHISTVINGNKEISASFAHKLDIALGATPGTWAKHQADYDAQMAEYNEKNGISENELCIIKSLKDVIDYFIKVHIMDNHCGDTEKVLRLRKVLCVNNLSVIPQITYNAAYRAQINSSTNIDPYILFAWQRMCELLSDRITINEPFSAKKLSDSIASIKKQMFIKNPNLMIKNLQEIFSKAGVAFSVVRHFRGAPVQGFIKQTETGKIILCVTIRGKKADRFWFSLFHEIGHLINGDLNTRFVDFDSVKTESEEKADSFARDTLINPTLYKAFIESEKYQTLYSIKTFAQLIEVPYWIVIGRLHNDEWIDWSYLANEVPSLEWEN